MIYAYTRVSTSVQTLDNQRYGIKEYCKTHSMKVDFWFEEKVSGKRKAEDRELGDLLRSIKKGDELIVTEFSRLGRSLPDVLETIQKIKEKGAILRTIKENFVLDDSLSAKILSSVLALISDISRDLLSSRIKEALAARKAKGIKLGRRVGSKNKHSKLEAQKDYIEMCLATGKSLYFIRNHLRTHAHTLKAFLLKSKLADKYGYKLNPNVRLDTI